MTNLSQPSLLEGIQRVGPGLAMILFPLLFIFAYAAHPNLLTPRLVENVNDMVARVHHNSMLHLGHVFVLFSVPLVIVAVLQFVELAKGGALAWLGFTGGVLAIFGAVMLAADKGALCLVISAFDTLPESQFAQLMPGLAAMQAKAGWLVLTWGLVLLPVGVALQAVALLSAGSVPTWQGLALLVGTLMLAVPDGFEIVSLAGSVLLATALIPLGLQYVLR